ncbi:hypothetical protein C8J56DRAFT_34150 [Mycena floridula]|nr:hypothetical protein C8J56DRAFT_34150 [Mycena floridula]
MHENHSFPCNLPPELWIIILQKAAEAPELLDPDYILRIIATKQSSIEAVQLELLRKSRATKCASMRTCKAFHSIITPYFFEAVAISGEHHLSPLSAMLKGSYDEAANDENHPMSLGRHTRRLDIHPKRGKISLDDPRLLDIIRFLPNLAIITLSLRLLSEDCPQFFSAVSQCESLQLILPSKAPDAAMRMSDGWLSVVYPQNIRGLGLDFQQVMSNVKSTSQITSLSCSAWFLHNNPELVESIARHSFPNVHQLIYTCVTSFMRIATGWLPLLQHLGPTLTRIVMRVGITAGISQSSERHKAQFTASFNECISCISETCPKVTNLLLSLQTWAGFTANIKLPRTVTTLELRSDQLQAKSDVYRRLFNSLETLVAEGLQVVQLVDGRNSTDLAQRHRAAVRDAADMLKRKTWRLLDGSGRNMIARDVEES